MIISMKTVVQIKRSYIRDGRAPVPVNEKTSHIMSAVRAKDTKPELLARKILSSAGVRGYRLHSRAVPGRPDIVFPTKKVAVFVHGCFWHGCPYCKPKLPKTHRMFWFRKIRTNKLRDARKLKELKKRGWNSIVLWACRLRSRRVREGFLTRTRGALT